MKYKFKKDNERGYIITEDGHVMFPEDVVRRLNRLNYLEKEFLALKVTDNGLPERCEKIKNIKGDGR